MLVCVGGAHGQSPTDAAGRIAFHSDSTGYEQIYSMRPDGTGIAQLTAEQAHHSHPALAPGGRYLAFVKSPCKLFTMDVAAGESSARMLTDGVGCEEDPAWSPNGRQIAFASTRDAVTDTTSDVYVINADGSNLRRLTSIPASSEFHPTWAPDGSRIAFEILANPSPNGNASTDLYVMSAAGGPATRLTSAPGFDSNPAWSPAGDRIVFASDRSGDRDIYVMNPDGSGQTNVTNSSGYDDYPTWSPDGEQIAFTSGRTGDQEIFVMDADGTPQIQLTINPSAIDGAPSWAPDVVTLPPCRDGEDNDDDGFVDHPSDPGCSGPDDQDEVDETFKYVALGDSFSAGEGIEPFFEADNACHRSTLGYPTFIDAPGIDGGSIYGLQRAGVPGYEWGFQACSGATTTGLLNTGWHQDPLAQLDPDRSSDTANRNDLPVDMSTDLVTLTVGGNDLHFAAVLRFCAFSSDCTTERFNGAQIDPADGAFNGTLREYLRRERDQLSERLDGVYERIADQAPNAEVVIAGYPHLFPQTAAEQNCAKVRQYTYTRTRRVTVGSIFGTPITIPVVDVATIGFSQREQNYVRQAVAEANQLIAARAQRVSGTQFVAVDGRFAGHEICGRLGEWINAPTVSPIGRFSVNDQSFHPTDAGQRLGYAAAINEALRSR